MLESCLGDNLAQVKCISVAEQEGLHPDPPVKAASARALLSARGSVQLPRSQRLPFIPVSAHVPAPQRSLPRMSHRMWLLPPYLPMRSP